MQSSASTHPYLVLATLTAVCLAAFLAAIPIPRADGQLLTADGFGYYAYLPPLVLDHDLDVRDQFAPRAEARSGTAGPARAQAAPPPWTIGTALLWLPFFVLAHALALALDAFGAGIRLDGLGYWHQAFVLAGSIVYGGLALVFAFDVARRVASAASALWATVLLLCAGNLVYYMTAEPSMAHAVSAFAVGLFYVLWMRWRGAWGPGRCLLLGASLGLIALVRTQEVLLAVVPLATELGDALRRRPADGGKAVRSWLRGVLLVAAAACVTFLPQAIASHALLGAWWRLPQLSASFGPNPTAFSWSAPHFADVLFSARRGLFSWHPVYLIALLGLVPLWRRDRALAAAVLLGVAGQAYVIGSWFYWWQGRSFGGRTFIGCMPLFAASLAALLDWALERFANRRRMLARLGVAVAGLLVLANLLLFLEYRVVLSWTDRAATWHDLGVGRLTFLSRRP